MIDTGDALHSLPKKYHVLTNIFLQSDLQGQLEKLPVKPNRAPNSHQSLNQKVDPKKQLFAGRPIFDYKNSNHAQNINAGRNRIFYTSNVF